jgi:hypothetical protein
VIDVEPYDIAIGVEVDDQTLDDLSLLRSWTAFEFDIETVGVGINSGASLLLLLAKATVEECVVNGLCVAQRHHAKKPRFCRIVGFDPTPKADSAVRLRLGP